MVSSPRRRSATSSIRLKVTGISLRFITRLISLLTACYRFFYHLKKVWVSNEFIGSRTNITCRMSSHTHTGITW